MPYYAIVENNRVSNIIVADDEVTALAVSRNGSLAIQCKTSDLISQGWIYDGKKLSAPVTETPSA